MVKTIIYLHSDKDRNYDLAREIGLSEDTIRTFAYTCYEVRVTVEVNPETGEAKATHFNGVKLEHPVEV